MTIIHNKYTNFSLHLLSHCEYLHAFSHMLYYQRYDSLLVFLLPSHHGVAFARSSLTICKYAHVVAFEGVKKHLLSDVSVHLHLGRIVDVLRLHTWREQSGYKDEEKRHGIRSLFFN